MSSSTLKDTSAVSETNALPETQPLPEDASQKVSVFKSIRRYIWDSTNKSSKEKWFLFKLDIFLLTISCLGYFSKNLDQANLSNAYVSGMSEALKMEGNELTYTGNVFTAGYVLGQLPADILVTRIRPSILIPTVEIFWSIFTFCSAAVKTTSQLYAMRFLLAICEGTYFPTVVYIIGSWYTKSERGKRMTIFYATASLAGMLSGYLQAGAYKGLNGVLGHAGWQ
jgi:MFS family permease